MDFFVRPTSNEFYQLSQASLEGQLFLQKSESNFHFTHISFKMRFTLILFISKIWAESVYTRTFFSILARQNLSNKLRSLDVIFSCFVSSFVGRIRNFSGHLWLIQNKTFQKCQRFLRKTIFCLYPYWYTCQFLDLIVWPFTQFTPYLCCHDQYYLIACPVSPARKNNTHLQLCGFKLPLAGLSSIENHFKHFR